MKTASVAAVMADEYVLLHANGSAVGQVYSEGLQKENIRFRHTRTCVGVHNESAQVALWYVPGIDGRFDPGKIGKGKVVSQARHRLIPVYM